jgi:hypothetical protein
MVLGSTQPLTEMSTRNLPGDKGRLRLRPTVSPSSESRLSRKCWSLDGLLQRSLFLFYFEDGGTRFLWNMANHHYVVLSFSGDHHSPCRHMPNQPWRMFCCAKLAVWKRRQSILVYLLLVSTEVLWPPCQWHCWCYTSICTLHDIACILSPNWFIISDILVLTWVFQTWLLFGGNCVF